jgi:hypothetical protein
MPKKVTKKAVKKPVKKAARKKPKDSYECGVCGYRLVVDELCGCETEHVIYCCEQPMKKKAGAAA